MGTMDMKAPLVSVIVTTKNEEQHVRVCLESIKNQTYGNVECLVVDNASRDRTKDIARRYTQHVYDKGPERSAQRNYGAQMAKGAYVLFLDADMEVSPNVIAECIRKKSYAVVIPERSVGIGFWTQCKILERRFYEGVDWMEAARFFRKSVFMELSGYNEQLTGPEDFELSQRAKVTFGPQSMGRISSYIVHHEGRISLTDLLKKKYYYGKKMHAYALLSESKPYFIQQSNILFRYALFFHKPKIFFKDPLHAAGMIVMKTLEMIVLAIGGLTG